jgi:hypothetical protein
MAGAGYKLFNTGDVLTAAQVNTYLNEQTVMVFASAAARTTALTSVLAEGMVSYLQDTNAVEVYNGSAWVGVSGAGDVTEVQAGVGISVASGTGPIPVITNSSTDLITTAGDILYGTAADTVARLGIGTANQVLKVNSGATAPEWAVDPTTDVVTTAGDLIYGTAADTVARLGIGTAGQVLQVNSGATAPEWATPAGGGKVLQVVQATYSTSTTNATSTYADTGLSATITPSTSGSRILCMIYHPMRRGGGNANNKLGIRLVRTSTTIHQSPDLLYTDTLAAHEADGAYSLAYLDSPSTTSATTYKTTFASVANTSAVVVQVDSRTAVMILTEIGA